MNNGYNHQGSLNNNSYNNNSANSNDFITRQAPDPDEVYNKGLFS